MVNKNVIKNYLKENSYDLNDKNSVGIIITKNKNEIVIKGSRIDLVELADYILDVALSESNNDHIHIDDLTLINKNSNIIKRLYLVKTKVKNPIKNDLFIEKLFTSSWTIQLM